MDFIDRFDIVDAGLDPFENPFRGIHQRCSASISRFNEAKLPRFKSVVDFLTLLRQLLDEFVKLGESTLEFLELNHHFREELVAFFRSVADI